MTTGDRPADEIEVTAEMVAAGLAAFREEAGDDYCQLSSSDEVLAAVFRAMCDASLSRARARRPIR